jgi:hypothetical protein
MQIPVFEIKNYRNTIASKVCGRRVNANLMVHNNNWILKDFCLLQNVQKGSEAFPVSF